MPFSFRRGRGGEAPPVVRKVLDPLIPDHSRKAGIAPCDFLYGLMDASIGVFQDGSGIEMLDGRRIRFMDRVIVTNRASVFSDGRFDYAFVEGTSQGLKREQYFIFGKLPCKDGRVLGSDDFGYLERLVNQPLDALNSGVVRTENGIVVIECAADSRSRGGMGLNDRPQNELLQRWGLVAAMGTVKWALDLPL